MYHLRMKGDHYQAGYRFGKRLKDHGIFLMDVIPFELTSSREKFAKECYPLYQEYYPEIVEEIKGVCFGQGIEYEKLATVLYSMYCIIPDQKCSCFMMKTDDVYLLGRNSDFLTSIEKSCANVIYKLDNVYHFQGNTTAFIEMEDGMNEYGLAVGFTSIYPQQIKPGINAGMIVRYILEKCRTVQEVIDILYHLPIASAQTLTLMDADGNCAVVECDCQSIEVIQQPEKMLAVNAFYGSIMNAKRKYDIDDWQASERYQTIYKTLLENQGHYSLELAQAILSGHYGFICQYDRKTGKDTVWSVIYDTKNKKIYRCEGNPSRKKFIEDKR